MTAEGFRYSWRAPQISFVTFFRCKNITQAAANFVPEIIGRLRIRKRHLNFDSNYTAADPLTWKHISLRIGMAMENRFTEWGRYGSIPKY